MTPQPAQLEALVAIADSGSFEAAARALHVTPSAISQRIRALESMAGQVLVSRTTPCRPTDPGAAYVRLGRQTRLLYDEARLEADADHVVTLPVAVNADSLATWFRDVLSAVAGWPDDAAVALRLRVEDQAYSAGLLRNGDALAAVTSDPAPVQGCAVEPLGTLRYGAAATPAFVDRWQRGRSMDWERMPVLVFNEKDALQHEVLAARGVTPRVVHQVPTSTDFHEAVRRGLGWCLLPEPQLLPDLEAGRLVRLPGRDDRNRVDVPLFWQRWRLDTPALTRLTDAVHTAARTHLR
jgi:LysR family transcriptional regulator, chromosome initiation inhibitor